MYISEFYNTLESRINTWINELDPYPCVGPYNVGSILACYVNFLNYNLRDNYCLLRYHGYSAIDALEHILQLPLPKKTDILFHEPDLDLFHPLIANWKRMLDPLQGQKVYYVNFQRMAEYIIPFIKSEASLAIVVSDSNIDYSKLNLPKNVSALHFVDSRIRLYRNDFLERNFPTFFSYANTIALLDSCIIPPEFYCVCGCQTQAMLWATICKSRGATSVCYQHGWPAFIHSAFKNMPYNAMVTWGQGFKELWHPYNPSMRIIAGNYPYPIKNGPHNCITFFLQGPYYIATERTQEMMLRLISECAGRYPEKRIMYRLHPESRIKGKFLIEIETKFNNVVDVSSLPLSEVYSSTRVAIAHYSSTIMECIAHGCCPLVFNPSPGWVYTPDIESLNLGYISTDMPSFHSKLTKALHHCVDEDLKNEWFGNKISI